MKVGRGFAVPVYFVAKSMVAKELRWGTLCVLLSPAMERWFEFRS